MPTVHRRFLYSRISPWDHDLWCSSIEGIKPPTKQIKLGEDLHQFSRLKVFKKNKVWGLRWRKCVDPEHANINTGMPNSQKETPLKLSNKEEQLMHSLHIVVFATGEVRIEVNRQCGSSTRVATHMQRLNLLPEQAEIKPVPQDKIRKKILDGEYKIKNFEVSYGLMPEDPTNESRRENALDNVAQCISGNSGRGTLRLRISDKQGFPAKIIQDMKNANAKKLKVEVEELDHPIDIMLPRKYGQIEVSTDADIEKTSSQIWDEMLREA